MAKPKPATGATSKPNPITPEEFAERYKALCQETGFQLAFKPMWAKSADLGDYRLVIHVTIEKLG